jgi:hypothetical protein
VLEADEIAGASIGIFRRSNRERAIKGFCAGFSVDIVELLNSRALFCAESAETFSPITPPGSFCWL